MFLFIDFCQVGWLPIILSFPLGLILGWLLWGRLKNELLELREGSARFKRKIQEQDQEIQNSNQRLAQLETEHYNLQGLSSSELEKSRKRITALEGELALASGEVSALQSSGEVEKLDSSVKIGQSRITSLEGELAMAKGRIAELEDNEDLALARKRITALEGELALASGELSAAESPVVSNTSIQAGQSRITVLEGDLALANGRIAELEAGEELALARERITSLEGELALSKGVQLSENDQKELLASRRRITSLEGELALALGNLKSSSSQQVGISSAAKTSQKINLKTNSKPSSKTTKKSASKTTKKSTAKADSKTVKKDRTKSTKSTNSKTNKKGASKSNKKTNATASKKKTKKDTDTIAKKKKSLAKSANKLTAKKSKSPTKKSTKSKSNKSDIKRRKTKPAKYAALKNDNLQIIEGIGPKMNQILVDNGISNWDILADKTKQDLEKILGKFGDRYKIIDPSDWPSQAKYASRYDFSGLVKYQKKDGSESKAQKVFIKLKITKKFKANDFKVIEGVGPKISELLQKSGIKTWKQLASTPVAKIQDILASAGKRYQLADPTTWPQQAKLAAAGKFDELTDLQDKLSGGKA